jgi:HK97 family phage portal protein
LHGNAYAILKRDGNFRVKELVFVHPQSVWVDIVGDEVEYTITPYRGPTIKAYTSDVLHLTNMPIDDDGIRGMDMLKIHRRVLANAIGGNNYAGSFMDSGISIGGVLRHETKSVSADRRKEIAQDLKGRYSGADNAGSVLVLDEGWQFQPIEMKANDQMFANSVKMSVEDASRLTGVPVHLLSGLENATFSNIEHQSREFVTYTLLPWVQRWAEELGRKLFTTQEQDNHFIRFNLDSLLRGDTESQAKLIQVLMQYGIATPNEIRSKFLDWNGRDDGDTPLTPANIVGKQPAPQAGADDEDDDERANIVE